LFGIGLLLLLRGNSLQQSAQQNQRRHSRLNRKQPAIAKPTPSSPAVQRRAQMKHKALWQACLHVML
jgi:hypothetical protein